MNNTSKIYVFLLNTKYLDGVKFINSVIYTQKTFIMYNITAGIIILLILLVLWIYFNQTEPDYSKTIEEEYGKMHGDVPTKHSENVKKQFQKKIKKGKNPSIFEHYAIYDINKNVDKNAQEARRSLNDLIQEMSRLNKQVPNGAPHINEDTNNDILFVLGHMEPADDVFANENNPMPGGAPVNIEHDRTQLQAALYNSLRDGVHQNRIKNTQPRKVKSFQRKIRWRSDSQNVHDLGDDVKAHVKFIFSENSKNKDIQKPFASINEYIRANLEQGDKVKCNRVMKTIGEKNIHMSKIGKKEIAILENIWKRVHLPVNRSNHDQLKNAFFDNMKDCIENGSVVCSTGRTSKMLSTFSKLDVQVPNLGSFRSKQMMRNEIYKRSSDILQNKLNTMSKELQDMYNKGDENPEIVKSMNEVRLDINKMTKEYKGKLSDGDVTKLKEECLAVI